MQPLDAVVQPHQTETKPQGNPNIREIGISHRFDAVTARKMVERRRELRLQRQQLLDSIPTAQPSLPDPIVSRVARIDERIEAILDEMENSESAKDTQALAMALDRLCGVWSLLTGHPRPGVRRDAKRRGPSSFASPVD